MMSWLLLKTGLAAGQGSGPEGGRGRQNRCVNGDIAAISLTKLRIAAIRSFVKLLTKA